MGRSGRLHLTFSPPASPDQLKGFLVAFTEADYDAPVERIDESGTKQEYDTWTVKHGQEWHTYYRKPMIDGDEIADLLTSHGISGAGWLVDETCDRYPLSIPDWAKFTFGVIDETIEALMETHNKLNPQQRRLFKMLIDKRT